MKKTFTSRWLLALFFLGIFLSPLITFAQTNNLSLVYNCDGTATSTDASGTPPCDFTALINTGTHLIQWLFYVSIPLMVVLMAYAGILYMTGVQKNIDKAKNMFIKVALGFTIMLIAFVCIYTVIGWIGNASFTTTSNGTATNPAVLLSNTPSQ